MTTDATAMLMATILWMIAFPNQFTRLATL
jgi:hypothetical protein